MGFWDTVGAIGKGFAQHVIEKGEKYQAMKFELESRSDEYLANKFWKGSSQEEKRIIYNIMKERYGDADNAKLILESYR